MFPTITAGLDGSPESMAAADWAAGEARRRGLTLRLVHAGEWQPDTVTPHTPLGGPGPPQRHWGDRVLRDAEAQVRLRHPDLRIVGEQIANEPVAALLGAANDSEMLVIGSRGLSAVAGFLVGSVALGVVGRATRPVVLVRAGEPDGTAQPADPSTTTTATGTATATATATATGTGTGTATIPAPPRHVVLGLDLNSPGDAVIGFAFEAAAVRQSALRVVHGWYLPAYYSFGTADLAVNQDVGGELAEQKRTALADALRPWREKFPGVRVTAQAVIGRASHHLVDSARGAGLVVIGRRTRTSAIGAHIGSVTHAVMHHAAAPVAVVPHD
ncbi:universal stress protein [Streptomyces sp. SID13588]|uniref:universal stress protein n=1 Tax=Streptomyces sp. SID13588 TaxID=2706051 RepID=UPI0013CC49AA|nr:universal stress protein [Streptomyces sp. SID13588]NEA70250.1 universal stress protein [Streptomyces sp. SID13588]